MRWTLMIIGGLLCTAGAIRCALAPSIWFLNLIDRNIWYAAHRFGGTTGASSDEDPNDEGGGLGGVLR